MDRFRWYIIGMENILENFIYRDEKLVGGKLEAFRGAGREKICLVADFDRTITPPFNGNGEEVSTWGLLSLKLPAEARNEEIELYDKFRPLEVAGKMTVEDALEWWSRNLDLYEKSKLKWSDLELEADEAIPARHGVKELFEICGEKNIPTIILSAGLKDVIELWCQKFSLRPEMILSTKLHFDAEGYICGWDRESLVHTLNKNEVGKKHLGDLQKKRPYAILIGDSMDDAAMVGGTGKVLRFFIDNQKGVNAKGKDYYDKVFEKFDLIIQNGSLLPIVETIKSM